MVLTLGLTYAAFTYNKTGETSELVLGDIWMKYTENNQLTLSDAMPMDISNYTVYKVNPIMATQELPDNELSSCINFVELSMPRVDPLYTTEMFCKGEGTSMGMTFQQMIDFFIQEDKDGFLQDIGKDLVDQNIIILENENYIVNPIMKEQEAIKNELSRCIETFTNYQVEHEDFKLDEGSDFRSFCKGTGTTYGMTIEENINYMSTTEYYFKEVIMELLNTNVISSQISEYKEYKINNEMTEEEINKCVTIFKDEWQWGLDEGESWESFCQGTGKRYGDTFQFHLTKGWFISRELNYLEENNIIFVKSNKKVPYFEFTISGKNTYEKEDIWYDVVLMHGDEHATRTTRIRDDLLRFALVEVENNEEKIIFNNRGYETLNNRRIHVETINANTMDVVNKTYRLYMWIGEDTVLGNVGEDYTMEEWEDVFASIKVKVNGDFIEKVIYTDERCFEYSEVISDNEVIGISITNYDNIACESDVVIPEKIDGYPVLEIYDRAFIDYNNNGITSVVIPNSVTTIGEEAFASNQLTSVEISNSLVEIGAEVFRYNFLTSIEIPDGVTTIGAYAFSGNFLKQITLGKNVKDIGDSAFQIYFGYGTSISNHIHTIANKSGNAFNWNEILDISAYTEEENSFATGTIKYNSPSGEKEILVTSE